MKTWNLILDLESLFEYILPTQGWDPDSDSIQSFQKLVRQHKIVWSDSLVEIVETYYDETYVAQLQNYISSENVSDATLKVEDSKKCSTIEDWLHMISTDEILENDWFIICKNVQVIQAIRFFVPNEKIYSVSDTIREIISNKIRRNSKDYHIRVSEGSDCKEYSNWFNELFFNEHRITVFDPYFVTPEGFNCLSKYLASSLKNKELYIYTDSHEWTSSNDTKYDAKWNQISLDNNLKIMIFVSSAPYKSKEEHDRHIFLQPNTHIVIGRGLTFLDARTGKTHGTYIYISCDKETTVKTILTEYPYNKAASYPKKQHVTNHSA